VHTPLSFTSALRDNSSPESPHKVKCKVAMKNHPPSKLSHNERP
jgi:hypothetical protein